MNPSFPELITLRKKCQKIQYPCLPSAHQTWPLAPCKHQFQASTGDIETEIRTKNKHRRRKVISMILFIHLCGAVAGKKQHIRSII